MSKKKIISYQTIFADSNNIDGLIERAIREGWQPFGGICAIPENSDCYGSSDRFCQVVVKYEDL